MPKWDTDTVARQLVADGRVNIAFQHELETTRQRIDTLLSKLLTHGNSLVREVAATILGERRKPNSIPALITALADKSQHVRWDALVAIEKCAGLSPGELSVVLGLTPTRPRIMKSRVEAWWKIVGSDLLA